MSASLESLEAGQAGPAMQFEVSGSENVAIWNQQLLVFSNISQFFHRVTATCSEGDAVTERELCCSSAQELRGKRELQTLGARCAL